MLYFGSVVWVQYVVVRFGLKVKEGASGFWALVDGTRAIEQHFVVVFFNQSPCFFMGF